MTQQDAPLNGFDRIKQAEAALELAQWTVTITATAHKGTKADLLGEVLSPSYSEVLAKIYADNVGPREFADSVTLGELRAQEARADAVFELVKDLSLLIARHDGAGPKELQELRKLMDSRPATLPTLATIEARRRQARSETPKAKAEAAAQARKEKEREADRKYAADAVRLRQEIHGSQSVEAADADEEVEEAVASA